MEKSYIHPLVLTLVVYVLADLAFSMALGFSAYYVDHMWSNQLFPALNSIVVVFSLLSVYFVAYSNVKLALILHGFLKLITFFWSLHCTVMPEFYGVYKQEAIATSLYYLLTLVFEMTAFFVINKMNIPFYPDDDTIGIPKDQSEEEDEVMYSCC